MQQEELLAQIRTITKPVHKELEEYLDVGSISPIFGYPVINFADAHEDLGESEFSSTDQSSKWRLLMKTIMQTKNTGEVYLRACLDCWDKEVHLNESVLRAFTYGKRLGTRSVSNALRKKGKASSFNTSGDNWLMPFVSKRSIKPRAQKAKKEEEKRMTMQRQLDMLKEMAGHSHRLSIRKRSSYLDPRRHERSILKEKRSTMNLSRISEGGHSSSVEGSQRKRGKCSRN